MTMLINLDYIPHMNVGFVGVGRMGANMARRLKDREFHITAVYDTNRAVATSLAAELGCAAAQDLSEVTAASDVIFTVVTDDNAMRNIFTGSGDNLLVNARSKLFINCATISPQVHVETEKEANKAGAEAKRRSGERNRFCRSLVQLCALSVKLAKPRR